MLETPPGTPVIFVLMGLELLFESRGKLEAAPSTLAAKTRLEARASIRRGTARLENIERTRASSERQVVKYHQLVFRLLLRVRVGKTFQCDSKAQEFGRTSAAICKNRGDL